MMEPSVTKYDASRTYGPKQSLKLTFIFNVTTSYVCRLLMLLNYLIVLGEVSCHRMAIALLMTHGMLCREIVTSFVVDFRAFVKMLAAKFWSNENCNPRWSRCKESTTLLAPQSNKRIISGDDGRCHV
jgi:hypothetical protein